MDAALSDGGSVNKFVVAQQWRNLGRLSRVSQEDG